MFSGFLSNLWSSFQNRNFSVINKFYQLIPINVYIVFVVVFVVVTCFDVVEKLYFGWSPDFAN